MTPMKLQGQYEFRCFSFRFCVSDGRGGGERATSFVSRLLQLESCLRTLYFPGGGA